MKCLCAKGVRGSAVSDIPVAYVTNKHLERSLNENSSLSSHELLFSLRAKPKSYSCVSSCLPEKYNQTILSLVPSHSLCTPYERRRLWASTFITGVRFTPAATWREGDATFTPYLAACRTSPFTRHTFAWERCGPRRSLHLQLATLCGLVHVA